MKNNIGTVNGICNSDSDLFVLGTIGKSPNNYEKYGFHVYICREKNGIEVSIIKLKDNYKKICVSYLKKHLERNDIDVKDAAILIDIDEKILQQILDGKEKPIKEYIKIIRFLSNYNCFNTDCCQEPIFERINGIPPKAKWKKDAEHIYEMNYHKVSKEFISHLKKLNPKRAKRIDEIVKISRQRSVAKPLFTYIIDNQYVLAFEKVASDIGISPGKLLGIAGYTGKYSIATEEELKKIKEYNKRIRRKNKRN